MALATTEYKELIIKMRFEGGKTYDAIAAEIPVSRATVVRTIRAENQRRMSEALAAKGAVVGEETTK